MTEAQWQACAEPSLMLEQLRGERYDRQRRLFVCACCRRLWHLLSDARSRAAVEAAERFADGRVTVREVQRAWDEAQVGEADMFTFPDEADAAAALAAQAALVPAPTWFNVPSLPRPEQAALLRDVAGPRPFRPASFGADRPWRRDDTVRRLAAEAEERQAFGLLPILGDALEDAGCADRAVLDHCRGPGPHVRGCWVVDLLMGKW